MIQGIREKANIKDLQSELALYRKIFMFLEISDNEESADLDIHELIKSIKDSFEKNDIKKLYDVLQIGIDNQKRDIEQRMAFSQNYKQSIDKEHIYEILKDDFVADLTDEWDEETVLSYTHDDNYVKNELIDYYGPHTFDNSIRNKNFTFDNFLDDIIKYRTEIYQKETLEYLSGLEKELNGISKTVAGLIEV